MLYSSHKEVRMMIDTHELKKRDLYLKKIVAFRDTEPVKVVTGIRRCGKSSLLKLMVAHLKETGIAEEQIIEMNFESHEFKKMCPVQLARFDRKCRTSVGHRQTVQYITAITV